MKARKSYLEGKYSSKKGGEDYVARNVDLDQELQELKDQLLANNLGRENQPRGEF